MISRNTFGYEVTCDGPRCQEYLDVDSPDHMWGDVTRTMRDSGWVSRKDRKGEWEHFCSNCK